MTKVQAVEAYFRGEMTREEMTIQQEEFLEKALMVEAMILSAKPDKAIKAALLETHWLTDAQARLVLADVRRIFGDLDEVNKKMARKVAIDMALSAFEIAREKGDSKAMSIATKTYMDAQGLNNADPDMPEFGKILPSLNVLSLPEGMEESIAAVLKSGAINLALLTAPEYVPYETVDDDSPRGDRKATQEG